MVTKKQTANDDKTEKRHYNERKNTETDKKTEEYLEEWLKEQSTSQDFRKGKKYPKTVQKKGKKQIN